MSAYNGGIDHHVFVVVIARQQLENALENSTLRPSTKALMNDLPIPEALRQIAPGNAGSVSVQDSFDEQPIVRRSASHMAFCMDRPRVASRKLDLEMIGLALLYPALERNVCVPGHHGYPRASDLIRDSAPKARRAT